MYHIAYHPQSSGLVENWQGQLKHLLQKLWEIKACRAGFMHFSECVLTLNRFPLGFFWRGWLKEGAYGGCQYNYTIIPHITSTFFIPS